MDQFSSSFAKKPARELDRATADILAVIRALYGVYPHPMNIAWILGARSQEEAIRSSMELLRTEGLLDGSDAAAFFTEKGYRAMTPTVNPASSRTNECSATYDLMEMSDPGKKLLGLLKAHFDDLTRS